MESNDQLIERITKQVLQALNQGSNQPTPVISGNVQKSSDSTMSYSNSAIILLTGGNKELPEVRNQMLGVESPAAMGVFCWKENSGENYVCKVLCVVGEWEPHQGEGHFGIANNE